MAVIKVGYHSNNEVTRKYRILKERQDGKYKVCSFTVMTRADGSQWLAEGKPTVVSELKNIHEEEIGVSNL